MPHKTHRNYTAVAVAFGLFVATAGAAFAATLTLGAGFLATGSRSTSCQTSTLTPTWVLTYDAGTPGYRITAVTLQGLSTGCLDRSVKVVVADAAGTQVATGSGTTPGSGTTATVTLTTPLPLSSPWPSQLSVVVYA